MSDTDQTRALPSGRFVLRLDPHVHAALRSAADAAGLSLNEYCARKLASPGGAVSGPAVAAVERAMAVVGGSLVGVAVFGSWARREPSSGSDVDLLVVVDPSVRLERALYHRWDELSVWWDSRRVEPHFAHLPGGVGADERISGLWAEVAVDGVVLFERGLDLSEWLAAVRGRIAAGDLVRRWSHGQPYWVGAA